VDCLAESMVGRGWSVEEVVELRHHRIGNLLVEVVGVKEEVNNIRLLIMILFCEEDTAIEAKLDPLGINVISVSDGDLGSDSPIVVLVTNGLKGKLKLPISLL
jgi:hypothetical protein